MDRRKFIAGTMLAAGGVATAHANGRIPGNGVMPKGVADEPAKPGMHKFSKMRTITLEEHYVSPAFIAGPGKSMPASKDPHIIETWHDSVNLELLDDVARFGAGPSGADGRGGYRRPDSLALSGHGAARG